MVRHVASTAQVSSSSLQLLNELRKCDAWAKLPLLRGECDTDVLPSLFAVQKEQEFPVKAQLGNKILVPDVAQDGGFPFAVFHIRSLWLKKACESSIRAGSPTTSTRTVMDINAAVTIGLIHAVR